MKQMTSVVDNITGLFGRGFITAGLLPILVAGCYIGVLWTTVIGIDRLAGWVPHSPTRSVIVIGIFAAMLLLVMALLLRAARTVILAFFSGENWFLGLPGIRDVLIRPEQRRSRRLLDGATSVTVPEWEKEPDALRGRFRDAPLSKASAPDTCLEISRLLQDSRKAYLAAASGEKYCRKEYNALLNRLLPLFGKVKQAALSPINQEMIALAEAMAMRERYTRTAPLATWLEQFGPSGIVRCTRLGNRLLAIDAYPYRRYHMEGSIFWPHVEQLADGSLREDINSHRAQLEMILSYAAVFLVLAVGTALIGRWVGLHWFVWLAATVVAAISSWLFYRSGIVMADALGKTLCMACDLLRQDVLRKMGLEVPPDLPAERQQWVEVSRLVAYGNGFPRYASPQTCMQIPVASVLVRSAAITVASSRIKAKGSARIHP